MKLITIIIALFLSCSTIQNKTPKKCKYEKEIEYVKCIGGKIEYSHSRSTIATDEEYDFIKQDCCNYVENLLNYK